MTRERPEFVDPVSHVVYVARVPLSLAFPPPLAAGARVALVSPAGPLRDELELERAHANARVFGWEPVEGAHAAARRGYLGGDDAERAADLQWAVADARIDGIWCTRGGYGVMRLLERVDLEPLRRRPKAILGFSDITALHAAVGVHAGIVSYHGPTARQELSRFDRDSMQRAIVQQTDPCGRAPGARELRPGRARGRLAGGNLALLAALCGTRWLPELGGAILVLEDVNEAPYRIDRMLRQLLLAGALQDIRAIAFGHCSDCESPDSEGFIDDVVGELATLLDVPCLAGLPIGHIPDQWTVPLGATAVLDTEEPGLHIEFTP